MVRFRLALLFCCLSLSQSPSVLRAEDVTFEQHIRPIFKAHCLLCHGEEEKPKGKLDLRLPSLIVKGGKRGPGMIAGDVDKSLLWQRISSDEMPEGPKKLSAREKELIKQWIAGGAKMLRPEPKDPAATQITEEDRRHWAFQPIGKPAVPMVPSRYQAPHKDSQQRLRLTLPQYA